MSNGSISYGVHKVTPVHGAMCKFSVFVTLQNGQKMSWSKQQVLCTTLSSQLTVETMIEGQSQTMSYGVYTKKCLGCMDAWMDVRMDG